MSDAKEPKSSKLKEVYRDRTVEDQRQIYKDWADTYDTQTTEEFGWMGFKPAAEAFAQRVPDRAAKIMDAGCGTGLSGEALSVLGYTNIHGRDLSPEMLKVADGRNVYQSLGEVDLTNPLGETGYDAIISVGVFGFGPPFPNHISHLVSAVKTGGLVILTVNGKGWIDRNWPVELPAAVQDHGLVLKEQLEIPYLEKEEIDGKLLVFVG